MKELFAQLLVLSLAVWQRNGHFQSSFPMHNATGAYYDDTDLGIWKSRSYSLDRVRRSFILFFDIGQCNFGSILTFLTVEYYSLLLELEFL